LDARADMDELLNALLPFAQQMIEQHGEFYPSGASMTAQGEVSLVAADTGEEMPASQDLIQASTGSLRQRADADEIRAAAIVAELSSSCPMSDEQTPSRFPSNTSRAIRLRS
jgi:hypothetical protein